MSAHSGGHSPQNPRVPAGSSAPRPGPARWVALAGNPNCGKTTLFNGLTGLRAKVGNYPGVTVERKEGRLLGTGPAAPVTVLDLPGTYSLSPQSLDEQIARDVLFRRLPDIPALDLVVVVVDASNLQRNLYFATQVIELGYPTFIALNMTDVARAQGREIDPQTLGRELGVPVFPLVASRDEGVATLRQAIANFQPPRNSAAAPRTFVRLPEAFRAELTLLAARLRQRAAVQPVWPETEAQLLLGDQKFLASSGSFYGLELEQTVAAARARLEGAGVEWHSVVIEARYAAVAAIEAAATTEMASDRETLSDRLDRVFTHRVWGLVIFVGLLALIFQTVFSVAELPMGWIEAGVDSLGGWVGGLLAPGPLNELLVKGVIKGVGAVVVFLPQICFLFFFIGLLEDTGYMARAAFLMDRLMSRVGLHGKSFIPMLSSFACAIPGIMATRTIETAKDRLVTILVAPLMSCSARLPVYTVLIAACIPDRSVLGVIKLPALVLLSMYLLGIVVALAMAWLFKKTLLKGPTPILIMELPPYKRPMWKGVLRHMWDRSRLFLRRAGTVILGINILLWFLASYPRDAAVASEFAAQRAAVATPPPGADPAAAEPARAARLAELDKAEAGEQLRHSLAGRMGRLLEPVIAPLGFDWKIGIGIVSSFAAREVFVSTMSLVYNIGELADADESTQTLAETLRQQQRADGTPVYTTLVAISLMVFYVFALQCVSTVAVVRRETNGWKWAVFQWAYMGALAWTFSWVTYQGGRLLGWG